MELPKSSYGTLMDTLRESIDIQLELGSFGLYCPSEDRIIHLIPPSELPEELIKARTGHSLSYIPELTEMVGAFNRNKCD